MSYTCQYCKKSYARPSTLSVHQCELKRRYQQQNDRGVQIGFKSYLRFYELTQGSAKLKTYENFVDSPYYTAFVKYGWFTIAIRAVNVSSLTDWLLKNNKKLDNWCRDAVYSEWLQEYIKKEAVQDALERSLNEMQEYADSDSKLQNNFNNYFRLGSSSRIVHHITNGRVSPWVIFNCDSGIDWLSAASEEELKLIMPWINPEYWQKKLHDYMSDTEWVKSILRDAGL